MSHSTIDKAIFTALSSTQIVDGFFVKETRDLSDTIEYLVGLHETILKLHQVGLYTLWDRRTNSPLESGSTPLRYTFFLHSPTFVQRSPVVSSQLIPTSYVPYNIRISPCVEQSGICDCSRLLCAHAAVYQRYECREVLQHH